MEALDFGVVGFLDILGFSDMVTADSEGQTATYLPRILEVVAVVRNTPGAAEFNLRVFSDSIVLSTALSEENILRLIQIVRTIQREFVKRNILIRGGVAYGKHFVDPVVLFSHALVRAYELERT